MFRQILNLLACASYCFGATEVNIPVPFKAQEPPGTHYTDRAGKIHWASLNCGPAAVLMVRAKWSQVVLDQQNGTDISRLDTWLAQHYSGVYHDNQDGNGDNTNAAQLLDVAQHYVDPLQPGDLDFPDSSAPTTWVISDLLNELASGYPVVIGVKIKMSTDKNALGHFMVLRGITYLGTDNVGGPCVNGCVIVNDPGLSAGAGVQNMGLRYSLQQFTTSWGLNYNAVVVIHPATTGTVSVSATLNSSLNSPPGNVQYNGPVSYTLLGPANFSTTQTVLQSFSNLSPGPYRLNYNSAGPPNSTLTGILPCAAPLIRGPSCDSTLSGGQTLPFTLQFTTNPTAGFLMISGNQSAPNGQTLNVTVAPGASAPVSVSAGASLSNFPGGSIVGWSWSISGTQISTSPSFGQAFSKGTYQIGLVVTDRAGAVSALASGTLVVTETPPPNGWRMSGYNGSRTNNSQNQGPSALPTFQPLITNAPGNLLRIAPDGSLLLFDGTNLKYFSAAGTLLWSVSVGNISDVAIGPSGTIYTSTPDVLTAWNPINGQLFWPAPYSLNIGNETSALAIDSAGIIYVVTGASFVGPTSKVTAINPNGSLKWERGITFRGYEQFVLSTDESVGYILDATQSPFGTGTLEHGVSTSTGNDVYDTVFPITDNTYAFAPWGTLYAGGVTGLTACTASLGCNGFGNTAFGVATLIPPGIIVSTRFDNLLQVGFDRSGNLLWTATERYNSDISDANGTLYAIAPLTSDVVALNGSTGAQLWRQHFVAAPSTILLGDDGCLYVGSNSVAVYKACH